ncbi:hypothetical protein [Burkholderia sp. BCC1644]|uniref:hypothetical protein n=1 Tax=Burkholderia sp. BCC1644 TaxID=2676293 RepID=UPI00159117C8|nr:hypothetical protein [Burkholderia sp. BCC1644]
MAPPARVVLNRLLGGIAAGLAIAAIGASPGAVPLPMQADARLDPGAVVATHVPRYGVNLGSWTTWGAEQLSAHIVKNPGLQPGIDRALLVVATIGDDGIGDDAPWAARPPGAWDGARFAILTGASRGASGVVSDPPPAAGGTRAPLGLTPRPAGLARGDVIALTRDAAGTLPLWWQAGDVRPAAGAGPAGGPAAVLDGTRGVAALRQYFDMLGPRAGKLLPLDGRWRMTFQVRALRGAPTLHAGFGRDRARLLVDRTIAPGPAWQTVTIDFDGADPGPAGPVTLSLEAAGGVLELAAIDVEDRDPGAGGFRRAVVDTLKALHPGYLRDWQGQLADTAANRFAAPFDRRPTRYRPGDAEWQYGYGTADLFALCAAVGARPWLVLPTTLDDAEAADIGRRLGRLAQAYGIDETVIEFGNENWNAMFRPAGIMNPDSLAERADRVFGLIREAAGTARLHRVVGAQYANPGAVERLGARLREADGVAVAPYFLYRLSAAQSGDAALDGLLDGDRDALAEVAARLRRAGKQMDVYEVNFHTTLGDAPAAARADLLARGAAGTALAARLVAATLAGSRRQAVYSLTGFDTRIARPAAGSRDALIPLWGITRDLAGSAHWRPTGTALAMLNDVAGGTVHEMTCTGAECGTLLAAGFDDDRIAVVSRAARPMRVTVPCHGRPSLTMRVLDDTAPQSVAPRPATLACRADRAMATLPPRSLTTVQAGDTDPADR